MPRILVITITLLVSLPLFGQNITPQALWDAMVKGNKEFVGGKVTYDAFKQERTLFSQAQAPPITILACADSRVPPELVFNQSLGALFVVRTAGNVADEFGIASIEYAISQGYTKLIVVLGHESCGAIKACLGTADPDTPALTQLAQRIRSSFTAGIAYDGGKDAANVKRAVEANVRASAAQLLAQSKMIREAVTSGEVKVVTAYYDLDTGEVTKVD